MAIANQLAALSDRLGEPDLGPTGAVSVPLPGGAVGASASTVLNAGPFVGMVGGLLLAASAVGHTDEP